MSDEHTQAVPEEAFALLAHEVRLDILRAFFTSYEPVDPEDILADRTDRERSYSELMAATGLEDSGKFNYHLDQLRGVYVEEREDGYVPTAGAVELYEAVYAARPTVSIEDDLDVEATCPHCGGALETRYEQEYLTIECPACDGFWGLTYRFPKAGLIPREGEEVFEAVYQKLSHDVSLARTGQCPSCGGLTTATVPTERLDSEATPTIEFACETCSWLATIDIVTAFQFDPDVSRALLEVGIPAGDPYQTESVVPEITGNRPKEPPGHTKFSISAPDGTVSLTVDSSLEVLSVEIED